MTNANYTLRILGWGEEVEYHDAEGALLLERTYMNGHRLFCDNTAKLPLARRRVVIENLCHYFVTKSVPSIFVIDEADGDRKELEVLVAGLVSDGHQITVEYDSAAKREHLLDEMHLSVIRAGKKLTIQGVQMTTEEEYWRWKRSHSGSK